MSENLKDKNNQKTEKKHTKEIPKSPEAKQIEKKVADVKKISQEWRKIARNHLKKDVENNTSKFLDKNIDLFAKTFNFNKTDLEELVNVESWWKINAVSPTWAKWLMQLTTDPLKDMSDKDRWFLNYWDLFAKIPDETINSLKNKWLRIALNAIKKAPEDKNIYKKNIKEIISRAQNDYQCNFIVWCIYLRMIKENVKQNDEKEKKLVLANLKNLDINLLNKMLKAKNKDTINKQDIDKFIVKLNKDKNLYTHFMTYLRYNWDNNTSPWKIPHKYYYATSVINPKEKIA